ncbi:MAG: hypothetical protein PHI12_14815 [Dehalococcoidales bacterium]|nr:hypothetical protein [Dehalococcoidales bacterium]
MFELLRAQKCIKCGAKVKKALTLTSVSFKTESGEHKVQMDEEGPFCNTCTQVRAWELVAEEEKRLEQLSIGKTINLIVQSEG